MLDTARPKKRRPLVVVSEAAMLPEMDPASKLDYIPCEWTQAHFDYWYPITSTTLFLYDVVPISAIISAGKVKELHDEIAFAYTEHSPYLKILRPFADKRSKWRNTNPKDHLHGNTVAQMFNPIKIEFITKSLKDVMALYECGYSAVGTMSEGVTPDTVPLLLATNAIVLMDNDEAGMKAAERWKEAGYRIVFIEEEGCKDMFDLVSKKGIEYARCWLEQVCQSLNSSKNTSNN